MDWDEVRNWTGDILGTVELLDEVDSTNAEVLRRPECAPNARPLVLVSQHQTRGRGRRGRAWQSAPDQSFLCTVGFEPLPDQLPAPCLPLLGAVAVCDALAQLGVDAARCKWPNDVLVRGCKVAGILVEVRSTGAATRAALGIGLNVSQGTGDLPGDCVTPPTSLAREGFQGSPAQAGCAVLDALDRRVAEAREAGPGPLIAAWIGLLVGPSARVRMELADRVVDGRLVDFEPSGALLIETDPAEPVLRVAGGHVLALRPAEEQPPR